MPDGNEKFEFPNQLLNQISECSAGGFLLFYLDQAGNVIPVPGFESQVAALSLTSFAQKYCGALDNLEVQNMMSLFQEAVEDQNKIDDLESGEDDLL